MLKPQSARLSGIQFHERLKLPGALAGDVLAFDLDDLVARPHAGGFRKRTLNHLRHENFCDQRIEEKPFALHLGDETEFLVRRVAGMREGEQHHQRDRDPCGDLHRLGRLHLPGGGDAEGGVVASGKVAGDENGFVASTTNMTREWRSLSPLLETCIGMSAP